MFLLNFTDLSHKSYNRTGNSFTNTFLNLLKKNQKQQPWILAKRSHKTWESGKRKRKKIINASENVCSFPMITIPRKDKRLFCGRMQSDQCRCRYHNPALSVIAGCKYLAAQQPSRNFSEYVSVCKNPLWKQSRVRQQPVVLSRVGVPGKMIAYVTYSTSFHEGHKIGMRMTWREEWENNEPSLKEEGWDNGKEYISFQKIWVTFICLFSLSFSLFLSLSLTHTCTYTHP